MAQFVYTMHRVGKVVPPKRHMAQGVGRALQLDVQVVAVVRLDNLFELALLCGKLIEVRIRLGVFGIDFVQTSGRSLCQIRRAGCGLR